MKSDFRFYLKVANSDFTFDTSLYTDLFSFQIPNLVVMSSEKISTRNHADGNVEISFGSKEYARVEFIWNPIAKKLSVKLDKYGLQNVFVHDQGSKLYLSNNLGILRRTMESIRLNGESVGFFLNTGFLPPGQTFFKDVRRLTADNSFDLNSGGRSEENGTWSSQFLKSSKLPQGEKALRITTALQNSCAHLAEVFKPDQIRMSGGLDTRVVSCLWPEENLKDLESVVVQSYWMEDGTDLDANISLAWSQNLGLRHKILKPQKKEFSFFQGHDGLTVVSGLCGGEFLGGQFHRVIPTDPTHWKSNGFHKSLTVESDEALKENSWIKQCQLDPEFWLAECARIFVQSTRSTIYHSLVGSWSTPCSLQATTVSPFLTAEFLEEWLATPLAEIGDYDLYQKVFQNLGERPRAVPLCSQFTQKDPSMAPTAEWGKEPKSSLPPRPYNAEGTQKDLEFLFYVLDSQEIPYDRNKILSMTAARKGTLNLFNFIVWCKFYFRPMSI